MISWQNEDTYQYVGKKTRCKIKQDNYCSHYWCLEGLKHHILVIECSKHAYSCWVLSNKVRRMNPSKIKIVVQHRIGKAVFQKPSCERLNKCSTYKRRNKAGCVLGPLQRQGTIKIPKLLLTQLAPQFLSKVYRNRVTAIPYCFTY